MRTSIPTLAVAASSILGADALQLAQPRDAAPRVVQHDIQRRHVDNPLARDRYRMRKRDNTVSVGLENEETLYFMNVSIGTPAQDLKLHIDTGSSDLWVNVPNSQLCSGQGDPCADSGTYDANSSSTYSYINSQFNITYVDGSGSFGDYASDVVSFGGVTLRDQQFGIGYSSSSQEGILGIGYPINEVAVAYNGGRTYANVPQHLMQTGQINSNAYSLWLNDLDASMGSILFGGVNTDKFNGQLQTVPIIPEQGVYAEFIIALTGVGVNGSEGSLVSNLASPALLDSGSSLMYLPDNVAQDVFNAVGAQYDERQGAAFVDCDLANSDMTIDFTFSSPTIRVGMDELVIVAGVDRGQPICILGIAPAGGSTPVRAILSFAPHTSSMTLPATRSPSRRRTSTPLRPTMSSKSTTVPTQCPAPLWCRTPSLPWLSRAVAISTVASRPESQGRARILGRLRPRLATPLRSLVPLVSQSWLCRHGVEMCVQKYSFAYRRQQWRYQGGILLYCVYRSYDL